MAFTIKRRDLSWDDGFYDKNWAIRYYKLPCCLFRSTEDIANMKESMNQTSDPFERLKVLGRMIYSSPQSFSGQQVKNDVLPFFDQDMRVVVLYFLNHFITEITSKLAHEILMEISHPRCMVNAAKILMKNVVDPDGKGVFLAELPPIPNLFKQMEHIVNHTHTASEVFGHISEKRVVFLVDTSQSMCQTFDLDHYPADPRKNEKGPLAPPLFFTASRLSLTTSEIRRFLKFRLPLNFQFNIITFGEEVNRWRPKLLEATNQAVTHACEFLEKTRPNGGTNTFQALQYALEHLEDDLDAIYLLSDGDPTRGIQDVSEILKYVKENIAKRQRKVVIHSTAVLLGDNHNSIDDVKARKFMCDLAALTGGVFRCLEQPSTPPLDMLHKNELVDESPEAFNQFYLNKLANIPQEILTIPTKAYPALTTPLAYQDYWEMMKNRFRDGKSDINISEYFTLEKEIMYRININLEWKETVQPMPPQGATSLSRQWTMVHSFKDFHNLHNKLHGEIKKRELDIHLPHDPLFGDKKSEKFLDERLNLLRSYLQDVYDAFNPVEESHLDSFLQFEQNVGRAN